MAGLVHLSLVILAFVKSSSLGREAIRLKTPSPNESPGKTVLRLSTGFAILAASIALSVAAYQQQPWYKMKSWEEIAKAAEEAKARGVSLTDDEARLAARKKLLTEHGRAIGLTCGAAGTALLFMIPAWVAPRSTSATRAMRLLIYASVGILVVGSVTFLVLREPWGTARKSSESRSVIRATQANDPTPSPKAIEDSLYWREFKEKNAASGFLLGVVAIVAASLGGAWLSARRIGRSRNPAAYSGFVRGMRWIVFLAALPCALSLMFRLPGASGVARSYSNDSARQRLGRIVAAEVEFHDNDVDGNGLKDWWVGDVSGLHRILRNETPIGLVDQSMILADASALETSGGRVRLEPIVRENITYRYRFAVIPLTSEGTPYAQDLDGDGMALESSRGFAFCAFPSEYRVHGVDTLIVDQSGVVWRKDTRGARVAQWPVNPEKDGWKRWIDGLRRPEVYVLADEDD